jgi:hypothetical protein
VPSTNADTSAGSGVRAARASASKSA